MRTRNYLFAVMALLLCYGSFGQDLRIPNTPAFSILDYEPASVMRPTSAKKLSTDLLNSFDKDGNLIMNMGLEVTPYWLKSRPKLSREQYLHPDTFQTILQTLSLSAATVKDTVNGSNNLGLGLRFEIVKGALDNQFKILENQMLQLETINSMIVNAKTDDSFDTKDKAIVAIVGWLKENTNPKIDDAKITDFQQRAEDLKKNSSPDVPAFCEALATSYQDERKELAGRIIEMENKRIGFSLEAAAASKFINTTGSRSFQKAGFWVNANYYVTEKDAWTATARLMTSRGDTTSVNSDLGFSYIRLEKDFNISIESMIRWYRTEFPDLNMSGTKITRLEKSFTYRIAAQFSYTIAQDISLNLSIGKEFDDPVLKKTAFFSILGVNYSIFNRQFQKLN
ncbi:hypothetical protein [Flavobacterium humi]|uniref:DUF3078 domain-containing protein n=1 Tax=Flavobacterium humi TaxID=2562683 RepID=A0A4Z0L9Q4_9FLAO|nr:hypothetical protein [Flavobacterium humi]TGD57920.1 hypothetical protein E4635_07880 [Flavobacterium humi]